MKLIPIFTENIKGRQNNTIFIDLETNQAYKAYHKEQGGTFYWIGFFVILAIMRGIQELSIQLPTNALMILLVIVIGVVGGKFYYKKFVYENLRELFLTSSMIEDYLEKGKKAFKLELWITVISLFIFVLLSIIFLTTGSFVIFIFMFFVFFISIIYLIRLPKERFVLYKRLKSK